MEGEACHIVIKERAHLASKEKEEVQCDQGDLGGDGGRPYSNDVAQGRVDNQFGGEHGGDRDEYGEWREDL